MSLSALNPVIFYRASLQDRLFFTKHLSTMIKAGVPISEAMITLRDQTKSAGLRRIIDAIAKDILNGQSLASSLKKHPDAFDEFYVSLIEISEASGTLEENLEFLSVQLGKNLSLRNKIQSASLYPALVFSATFIMGGFISLFILPKLVDFFEAFDVELPLSTKVLLWFANLMKDQGLLIMASLILGLIACIAFVQLKPIKPLWHALLLKIPFIGTVISYSQLAQFCRNFGTLVKSGVPIVRSLETTAHTLSNLKFRNDLLKTASILTKGKEIGISLEQHKFDEYPPLVSKMISIGEKTGRLDDTLLYLGDYYEEEIETISKNLTTILEPVLLLIIGLIVGFVAVAIISPIYQLTGSIRR